MSKCISRFLHVAQFRTEKQAIKEMIDEDGRYLIDVNIRVATLIPDGDRVSTESLASPIGTPTTAGEARETLKQDNRRWMGKLAAVGS